MIKCAQGGDSITRNSMETMDILQAMFPNAFSGMKHVALIWISLKFYSERYNWQYFSIDSGNPGVPSRWHPRYIAKFMGQTWGPPETCQPHMGPVLAPWTLLLGITWTSPLAPCSHNELKSLQSVTKIKMQFCSVLIPTFHWTFWIGDCINGVYFRRNWRFDTYTDSKVHRANMGPIWGPWVPGGPHVGPMNFAIRVPNDVSVQNIAFLTILIF